jgi:photosystem II stability/assembly factor-like uncharacterized protein
MADWEGLRSSLESGVSAPPLNALRERRRRRQQRRTIAMACSVVMIGTAGSLAVLGQTGQHAARRSVAGASEVNRFVLGDVAPAPKDHADYVVTDVDFVSARTGWAIGLKCVGERCDVATWRTADGGSSWSPAVTVARDVPRASFQDQDPSGGGVRSLRMVDGQRGYAFNPDLYATADGGATWTRVPQSSKVANVAVQGESVWVFERGCSVDDDCDAVLLTGGVGGALKPATTTLPPTNGAKALLRRESPRSAYVLSWQAADGTSSLQRWTGASWTREATPCADEDAQLLSAGAGRPLWAVCGKRAFVSADHGGSWRRVTDVPGGDVTDLVALSGRTAYVTTQVPARLLVTRDGGLTWNPAEGTSLKGYGYGNLDVADATHAWAMGDAGTLWRTADGARWERLALPPGARRATPPAAFSAPSDAGTRFTDVSFTDASHGWAIGRRCLGETCRTVLRHTTDGGTTWHTAPAPPQTFIEEAGPPDAWNVSSVLFADERNGWLYGDNALATHDGGRTWKRLEDVGRAYAVKVVGDQVWALSVNGCAGTPCYPSPVRWSVSRDVVIPVADPKNSWFGSLVATDLAHAYMVRNEPDAPATFVATRDGGRTWTTSPAPCPSATNWTPSAFAPERLWVACDDKKGKHAIARTDDGGAHWRTAFTTGGKDFVYDLAAFSEDVAFVLDFDGVRRTADGGRSWTTGVKGASSAAFLDAEHGWAIVKDVLWRTTDGVTWERLGRP